MTWATEPTASDIAEWFSKQKLHDGLDHANYVGGIAAIENKQMKCWNAYPSVAARVAYFWDWCDANGYQGSIETFDPENVKIVFGMEVIPEGLEGAGTRVPKVAESLCIDATITVKKDGVEIRKADGRKQVDMGMKVGDPTFTGRWQDRPKVRVPDFTALMKGESGAIGRALATLGMLALPSSGIASSDDMAEYVKSEAASDVTESTEPKTRRAENPKAGA